MFSIDHGVKLHIKSAVNLKARGVAAGIPDVCLPVPRGGYAGLWIELKSRHGELSSSQRSWREILESYGHMYVVARALGDAVQAITQYLNLTDLRLKSSLSLENVPVSNLASPEHCPPLDHSGSESQPEQTERAPTS